MRYRGSFTVEASMVLPLVTFIMIGMLYYICFLHDCAVMQSFSLRTAEEAAVSQQFEGMACQSAETSQSFSRRAFYRSFKSYRSADARCSLCMEIPIMQTAVLTGDRWDSSCKVTAITVDYPADWFKYHVRKTLK